ncbi:a-factor receptor [Neodidymelliopsis sp. IMI 364377]|nr:a-factor receptor [Neodidymelliopsis sp. IMI 364377]
MQSRFIRLFTICIVLILIVMPYSVYAFYYFYSEMAKLQWDDNWEELHGDQRTAILKFPSNGQVHIDKWGQVVLGYIVFFVFGTGTDAHNTYKKILLFIGLGKIFPSLYNMRESGTSTPSSFISARSWTSTCVSKAKTYFFKGSARMSSFGGSTFNNSVTNNSVALKSMDDTHPPSISSTTPVLRHGRHSSYSSLLKSMFTRSSRHQPVLPVFSQQSTTSSDHDVDKSVVETTSECFSAHAWATEVPQSRRNSEPVGVHIVHEVHVGGEMRQSEERKSADDWMLRP